MRATTPHPDSSSSRSVPSAALPTKTISQTLSQDTNQPSFAPAPQAQTHEPGRKRKGAPSIPEPKSIVANESSPTSAPPERIQPTPQMRAPSTDEVESDPLVKSVLDVFAGEIKRIHPKNP